MTSEYVTEKLKHTWLAHYPRSMQVIHDIGGEFTGFALIHLLCALNIKAMLITIPLSFVNK